MCFNFLCNIRCEKYFYSDQFKIKFYTSIFTINFNTKKKKNSLYSFLIFIKISIKNISIRKYSFKK